MITLMDMTKTYAAYFTTQGAGAAANTYPRILRRMKMYIICKYSIGKAVTNIAYINLQLRIDINFNIALQWRCVEIYW